MVLILISVQPNKTPNIMVNTMKKIKILRYEGKSLTEFSIYPSMKESSYEFTISIDGVYHHQYLTKSKIKKLIVNLIDILGESHG